MCDSPLFNALHSAELELIVCGEQDLDFAQLRKNAHYDGYQVRSHEANQKPPVVVRFGSVKI